MVSYSSQYIPLYTPFLYTYVCPLCGGFPKAFCNWQPTRLLPRHLDDRGLRRPAEGRGADADGKDSAHVGLVSLNGGFHKWGYWYPKWMVYSGKTYWNGWFRDTAFMETSKWGVSQNVKIGRTHCFPDEHEHCYLEGYPHHSPPFFETKPCLPFDSQT